MYEEGTFFDEEKMKKKGFKSIEVNGIRVYESFLNNFIDMLFKKQQIMLSFFFFFLLSSGTGDVSPLRSYFGTTSRTIWQLNDLNLVSDEFQRNKPIIFFPKK